MDDAITLPELPRALSALGVSVPYMTVWNGVVSGQLPAFRAGRRWLVRRSDLPEIANRVSLMRSTLPQ